MTEERYRIEYGYMGSGEEVDEEQLEAYHQIEALKKAGFLVLAKPCEHDNPIMKDKDDHHIMHADHYSGTGLWMDESGDSNDFHLGGVSSWQALEERLLIHEAIMEER